MAIQITKLFAPTVLTATAATIYTMASAPTTLTLGRGRVRFTNTTNTSASVTAYAVPSGGSAGTGNAFLDGEAVAANSHMDVDLPVLGPGDTFQALASTASAITVHELDGVLFS